jgi:hypothetical protein
MEVQIDIDHTMMILILISGMVGLEVPLEIIL